MKVFSSEKQLLLKGLGVAMGECVFGLSGPFFFDRFGMNIPEGAAVGCAAGAAIGYGITEMLLRNRNRKYGISEVPEVSRPDVISATDDLHTGGTRRIVGGDLTKEIIEEALTGLPEYRHDHIHVEVRGSKVVLKGTVGSWIDEAEAERIAFDTPGIQEVENRLEVVGEFG
ncbi:MAG TPA: BON domain-containing protein [Bryobacteraceae bacterium]